MKKLILIAVAFLTLQAVAQDKRKEDRNGKRELMKDLSAEELATLKSKKMTLALDLSEKQQNQVKQLLITEITARKQNIKAVKNKNENQDVQKPSKEERVKMMNDRLDAKIAMKQKMKTILTDDQYEKWEKIEGRRNDKFKKQQKKAFKK